MDSARDQLFPCSVLSQDEDVGIGAGHLVNESEHFAYRVALSDDLAKGPADLLLQHLFRFLEFVHLVIRLFQSYSRGYSRYQFFILPGFEDKVRRTLL